MSGEVAILGHAEFHSSCVEEGVECSVHDSLGADIHPSACSHLSVVCHAHLHCLMPVVEIVEHAHHHCVCDDHAGRVFLGGEKTEWMTGFNNECLFVGHLFEIFLNKVILEPVLANLACLAISDQFVGIKGDVEAEIVVDHNLESFSCEAFPFIFINRLGFEVACRAPAVGIYSASCAKLFQEFRSNLLMKFFRKISEGIF